MRNPCQHSLRCGGFTLIELLAVMAIMMMMTVIALTSYFGATRGAAMRGGLSHLQDTLTLARQAAIMQRRSAYVLFDDSGESPSYVVCLHEGTGRLVGNELSLDQFANREGLVEGAELYNLDTGKSGVITGIKDEPPPPSVTTSNSIGTGDCKYGWPVNPATQVPKGFDLREKPPDRFPLPVIFGPDGSLRNQDGSRRVEDYTIWVQEHTARGHGQVTVQGLTGLVSSGIVAGS